MIKNCKMKRSMEKIKRKISLYFCFPHMWVAAIIIALLMVKYLDNIGEAFWPSVFANIFAGLLTGLILCLISNVKQIAIARLKSKRISLDALSERIKEYQQFYNELRYKDFCALMVLRNFFLVFMIRALAPTG